MPDYNKTTEQCPFCKKERPQLIRAFHLSEDRPLLEILQQYKHDWEVADGICNVCLDEAHQSLQGKLLQVHNFQDEALGILPTPIRLNANPNYTGKGVTIAIIDSGFHHHPDLVQPRNRIKVMLDFTKQTEPEIIKHKVDTVPNSSAWHGTMTSVVCAGNGYLSGGLYSGLAKEAELVLLKVMDAEGKISEERIAKALAWIRDNAEKWTIKVVNLSVSGDAISSYKENEISTIVQQLSAQNINVVAAVGNNPDAPILPPANIPEVIAVGGIDDANTLDPFQHSLYHSTFGHTIDGLQKPDLIAPAIWLAAPILPHTEAHQKAMTLYRSYEKADGQQKTQLLEELKNRKIINPHYQHADGTSFAAPIVCSIIAQMLEAKPDLTPIRIREILCNTARPLHHVTAERVGHGVVQAGAAVAEAVADHDHHWLNASPVIDHKTRMIHFQLHRHDASKVFLYGSFNNWNGQEYPMLEKEEGMWTISLPFPTTGKYQYKYLVNDKEWLSDPINYFRNADGFGGFNSYFII